MGLKSFEQHRLGLRDGREVYFEGERVADVTTHPVLGAGMAFAAIDYRLAEEKEHRELAVCTDPKTGEPYSRFYRIPETAEDLLKRRELIAAGARVNAGPPLIKEIGTDSGVSGVQRVRAMKLIRDIAVSGFGGYQEILSIHAEGSLAAQRITILRDYDVKRCVDIVKSYDSERWNRKRQRFVVAADLVQDLADHRRPRWAFE